MKNLCVIRSGNVLLRKSDGCYILVDFGLARPLEQKSNNRYVMATQDGFVPMYFEVIQMLCIVY